MVTSWMVTCARVPSRRANHSRRCVGAGWNIARPDERCVPCRYGPNPLLPRRKGTRRGLRRGRRLGSSRRPGPHRLVRHGHPRQGGPGGYPGGTRPARPRCGGRAASGPAAQARPLPGASVRGGVRPRPRPGTGQLRGHEVEHVRHPQRPGDGPRRRGFRHRRGDQALGRHADSWPAAGWRSCCTGCSTTRSTPTSTRCRRSTTQIDGLEDQLFDDVTTDAALQRRAFELRRSLVTLRRLVLPMREVVNTLMRRDLAWSWTRP